MKNSDEMSYRVLEDHVIEKSIYKTFSLSKYVSISSRAFETFIVRHLDHFRLDIRRVFLKT